MRERESMGAITLDLVLQGYALAMVRAQFLELTLKFAVTVMGTGQLASGSPSGDVFEEMARLDRTTLGQLVQRLLGRDGSEQNAYARFKAIVERRNYLAHRWFLSNAHRLETEEGRALVLQDLIALGDTFQDAQRELERGLDSASGHAQADVPFDLVSAIETRQSVYDAFLAVGLDPEGIRKLAAFARAGQPELGV